MSLKNTGPLRIPRTPKLLFSLTSSGNSGIQLWEAKALSDWNFIIASGVVGAAISGWSVAIYGTLDPNALIDGVYANPAYPLPGATGGQWFLLPAKATESGGDTAVWSNPLTNITQAMRYQGPLLSVCAVATAASQTGTCNCYGWAED